MKYKILMNIFISSNFLLLHGQDHDVIWKGYGAFVNKLHQEVANREKSGQLVIDEKFKNKLNELHKTYEANNTHPHSNRSQNEWIEKMENFKTECSSNKDLTFMTRITVLVAPLIKIYPQDQGVIVKITTPSKEGERFDTSTETEV